MKKVRERCDVIHDYILGELKKRGMTLKDVAKATGKGQTTVRSCTFGITETKEIRDYIIGVIGEDPWLKFPPVEYPYPTGC